MRIRAMLAAIAATAATLAATTPSLGQDPAGKPILPPHPTPQYLPYDGSDCRSGDPVCIAQTVAEMYRRVNAVVPVCDHRAPFATAYLRVTEEWKRRLAASYFEDAVWTQHVDRVFAGLYFDAYDAYAAGRRDQVPPAWLLAFDAARDRRTPALGNFFVEFSAHVNRDLVFALEHVGLQSADGRSHKADYDKGNAIVTGLAPSVLQELVERYDPTTDNGYFFPVDQAIINLFLFWRERTWRNAQALIDAPNPAARQAIADQVERQTALEGQVYLEIGTYRDAAGSAVRDAYCAKHGGQRPAAYQPGAAVLGVRRGRLTVRGRYALVAVRCPAINFGCRGTVRITRGRRTLGRMRYALDAGAAATYRVRVPRSARGRAVVRLTRTGVPEAMRSTRKRVVLRRR
jgi:hypothetical protein